MQPVASEGQIDIDGMALEYRQFGPSPALSPTIIMLHEGLGSIKTWGEFPRRISERTGAGVFVYSRAGYGASPPFGDGLPIDYVRRHALDVLPKILEAIGFRRGMLLGHSDGASMAAAYAGSIDDPRLSGLVLMAPHFFVEPGDSCRNPPRPRRLQDPRLAPAAVALPQLYRHGLLGLE